MPDGYTPTLIYRVERLDGLGPHWEADGLGWDFEEFYDRRNPGPRRDGLGDVQGYEYFGFSSMSALWQWFHDDELCELLQRHGYGVAVYRVRSRWVRHGRCQVVFRRSEAKRESWKSFERLLINGIIAA